MTWRTLHCFVRARVRALRLAPLRAGALRPVCSFAAASIALTLTGCTVHTHSEWHTGNGGDNSSGAEGREHHAHSTNEPEGRHSDAGRDHVVRVTSPDKHAEQPAEQGDRAHSGHGVHHPTGPAPAGSSGSDSASNGGGNASGAGSAGTGPGDAAAAAAGTPDNSGSESSEAKPASSDQAASEGGKGTLKHENEPHVAKPPRRRGVKKDETHSGSESTTTKNGRRE